MNAIKIIVGFVPFFVFSLLAPMLGAGWAAAVGFAAAVVVVAVTAAGGVKVVPAVQAVVLLLMAVLAFADSGLDATLITFGPAIAALVLGLFMVITAAAGRPFTAQFARNQVPRELWHDHRYIGVNRHISIAWGLAVLLLGACHLGGALIGVEGWALAGRLAVNWLVPLACFWLVSQYTGRVASAAAHRVEQSGPA